MTQVAQTPGAWVITGGTNTGVMKYVGDALHGSNRPCIGIATWGEYTFSDYVFVYVLLVFFLSWYKLQYHYQLNELNP